MHDSHAAITSFPPHHQHYLHLSHPPTPSPLPSPGDDTAANVMRLCHKAARPVRGDIVRTLGVQELNVTCGAVCVYPNRVPDAVAALKKIGAAHIPVAAGESTGRLVWGRVTSLLRRPPIITSLLSPVSSLATGRVSFRMYSEFTNNVPLTPPAIRPLKVGSRWNRPSGG